MQLTNYFAAVAAAAACEAQSLAASQAIVQFPANPAQTDSSEASVILTGLSATTPPGGFGVPAGYFYALTATMPSKMAASQRFQLVTGDTLAHVLSQLTDAVNAAVISDSEPFITPTSPPSPINPAQAARRLGALNVAPASPTARYPFASVQPIVSDWLAYPPFSPPVAPVLKWQDYQPGYDVSDFWPKESANQPLPFLELVLAALTQGWIDPDDNVALALKTKQNLRVGSPPKNLASVADLEQASTLDWQTFFQNTPGWPNNHVLPPFTGLGSPNRRIAAFINYVQNFFAVLPPAQPTSYSAAASGAPPTLSPPSTDWLEACLGFYQSTPFTFGTGFNHTQLQQAAAKAFDSDPEAQGWCRRSKQ